MAYSATITTTRTVIGGKSVWVVTIVETGITGATDEATITGLPVLATLLYQESVLTPGTGNHTTTDPRVGTSAGGQELLDNGAPAATTRNTGIDTLGYNGDHSYYYSSRCDGDTPGSSVVNTTLVFLEGALAA